MIVFEKIPEQKDPARVRMELELHHETAWPEVVREFLGFLRACGYSIDDHAVADFIEDEAGPRNADTEVPASSDAERSHDWAWDQNERQCRSCHAFSDQPAGRSMCSGQVPE